LPHTLVFEDTSYAVVSIYEVGLNGLQYESHAFKVFPNPSEGSITVTGKETDVYSIKIYTMEGREVLCEQIMSGNTTVDLSELPKGMYLLKISSGTYKELKKLVLE
jgi:hypothetical protein